jgi:hypothetical protein
MNQRVAKATTKFAVFITLALLAGGCSRKNR